jgi:hypothetical protein
MALYSQKNEIDRAIYLASIRRILKGALKKENALSIKDDMKRPIVDYGFDFLTLVDKKGVALFRYHNPDRSGDSLIEAPFIYHRL